MKKSALLLAMAVALASNTYAQTPFAVETRYPGKGVSSKNISSLAKLSDTDITRAFTKVKASGMEFGYPQGGCQQRAEMMHAILQDMGIDHAKVWLFAPFNTVAEDGTLLELNDPINPNGTISWGYHVAPLVMSSRGDTLIIDPSINKDAPLKIRDWFGALRNSNVSSYTVLDPSYYFFYTSPRTKADGKTEDKINGGFYKYEPTPGWTTAYDRCVLERELAVNDVAIFLKKKLDGGYVDTGNHVRTLISSVNDMIYFFDGADRWTTQLDKVTVRNLLGKNAKLIGEAKKYYNERVAFWMDFKARLRQ